MSTALYWGPHFPETAAAHFWGPHFPDGQPDPTLVLPVGPAGVATFVLDLEAGFRLTLSWATDITKTYSGKEYRAQPDDDPKQTYAGPTILIADGLRTVRATLARYAVIGAPFLLALPHEEMTLRADSAGSVIPVASTANSDWATKPGQRVAVVRNGAYVPGVIQAFDGTSITLDVTPGSVGLKGARIMPLVAIYLDPQQAFSRWPAPEGIEAWQLNARALTFGFQSDARVSKLTSGSLTGAMVGLIFGVTAPGSAGNAYTLQFVADGIGAGGVTSVGTAFTYHFQSGVTFVDEIIGPLAAVGITILSAFNAAAFLVAGDVWGPLSFTGGADKDWGAMGAGASIAAFNGHPVWDRGIENADTISDSIQALSELVDLGGLPVAIGTADVSDWGRTVAIESATLTEWQWVKAFLATVRGCQRAFWLPTWRPDLVAVSFTGTTITILGPSDASGGFAAWWPSQRGSIMVRQANGTVSYLTVTAYVDNGDGTLTLNAIASPPLSGPAITMISWLDLCRFEKPDFEFTFQSATFSLETQARAVSQ